MPEYNKSVNKNTKTLESIDGWETKKYDSKLSDFRF